MLGSLTAWWEIQGLFLFFLHPPTDTTDWMD
jgi:hypothetical protein